MEIIGKTALVTGANRGIGKSLVKALLAAGAAKVYAAARNIDQLKDTLDLDRARVVPLQLDVTKPEHIAALARTAPDVQVLINNAGALEFGDALSGSLDGIRHQFAVNVFGPLELARALSAVIEANGGGAIANLLSVVALAPMQALAGYSASKAAASSFTQALRANLASRGISVHGVFPGPVDTDMAAEITFEKTSPDVVAKAIVDGIIKGDEDIFPDAMAQTVAAGWFQSPKAIENQFAAM
jgi:short-subunit dehydrogenase